MDWLKRLLGGVGRTVSNVISAPSKLGQAAGKAVRKEVQQAPHQIQQVQRQAAKVVPNLKVQDLIRGIQKTQKGVTTAKIPGLGVSTNQIGRQLPGATLKVLNTGAKVGGNLLDRGFNPIKYQQQAINKAKPGWQKNVAQGVANVNKFNPQTNVYQGLAKLGVGSAQAAAQAPVRVALSTAGAIDRYNGRTPGVTGVRPTQDITRALLGNDKVEGLASYGKSLPVVGKKLGVLAPLAGIALTAGDVAFGGKGKAINALSKASTASSVSKILKADKYLSKLDPTVAKNITADLVKTTDKKAIETILRNATQGKTSLVKTAVGADGRQIKQFAPKLTVPKKLNISPDDQAIIRDLNDYVAGTYQPGTVGARRLETDAAMIAEKYGLPVTRTTEDLAEALDGLNANAKNSIFYKKPGKSVNQNAPKPSKQDPLEALKAEAKPYIIPKTNSTDVTKLTDKDLNNFAKQGYTSITDRYGNTRQINGIVKDTTPDIQPYKLKSNELFHGTASDNIQPILKSGFKTGAELPENAFRGGGYGAMQDSLSFSTDAKQASVFGSVSPRGAVLKAELKPNAKVVTVRGIDYAEDLNPRINELKKKGIDAVYLDGEKEVVVLDKSAIKATGKYKEFKAIDAKNTDFTDLYNQATKAPKSFASDIPKSWLKVEPTVGQAAKAGDVLPGQVGKERGFISTVRNSPSSAPQVALRVKADYVPKANDSLVRSARSAISSDIMEAEKLAKTQITDKGVATASELIKHYQALGQYDKAVDVAQQAAKNLTEAGRTVQAASIYSRISPEGILRSTQAQIDKVGGKKLAAEVAERLTEMARAVQSMPDGQEKLFAVAELQKEVAKQIPTGLLQKLTTFRKAGLLTGLKTQMGNAVSNFSHIGLNKVADLPATAIDAMASLFTGQRTKVFTVKGQLSGGKEGVEKAGKFLKTGIDELALGGNKYDITPTNFKNKAVQKYTDTVFNLMGAADKPYRYSVFKNQLFDIGIAEAKNKGLRGAEARKFVKEFVSDPPMEAAQTAMSYAEKSVFANDTVLSGIATSIRQAAEKKSPPVAAALDIIMPFTKVPSAVITRLFDYTPVGAVKEVAKQVRNGKFDQRLFAQALGEAGTGTGVIWLGTNLAQKGLITGPMPTDQRERDLWTLEGKQPNAIRFGDKWYSFNYTSPVGQVLQMGAQIANGFKEGGNAIAAISSGIAGGSKAVIDQSFLQGIQGALDAVTDPARNASTFAKSTFGSAVPTLIADIAKATDPLQRQANTLAEGVTTRIPGLRLNATPKQDAFGRPLARAQSPLGTMLDPFRRTQANTGDNLQQELRRLQDQGTGILPDTKNKKIKVGNETVTLTPQQLADKNARMGAKVSDAWAQTVSSEGYKNLSDDKKRKALSNMLSDINEVEKARTLEKVNPTLAAKVVDNMSKTELALYNGGGMDLEKYVTAQLPKKPKIAKARVPRAKKAKKVRISRAKGRRGKAVKAPKLTIKKVKVAKFGKLATMKTPKIKVAKISAPRLAAARKAKKVKLVA